MFFLFKFHRLAFSVALLFFCALMGLEVLSAASEDAEEGEKLQEVVAPVAAKKYEGWFVIHRIQRKNPATSVFFVATDTLGFARTFASSSAPPRGLVLEVDYIPPVMVQGVKLRLLAETQNLLYGGGEEHTWLKVHQMLAYLPSSLNGSPRPVWFLSRDAQSFSKGSLSYLKMHVPAFDYLAF